MTTVLVFASIRASKTAHRWWVWWRPQPRLPPSHKWIECWGIWRHCGISGTGLTGGWLLCPELKEPQNFSVTYSTQDLTQIFQGNAQERASPLCRTSSIFVTMILCTSCSSVLTLPKFLRVLMSTYDFFFFWINVSGRTQDVKVAFSLEESRDCLPHPIHTKLNEGVRSCHCGRSFSILLMELIVEVFKEGESHLFRELSLTQGQVTYTLGYQVTGKKIQITINLCHKKKKRKGKGFSHWKFMLPASRVHRSGLLAFSLRKSCLAWLCCCCRSLPDWGGETNAEKTTPAGIQHAQKHNDFTAQQW